MINPLRRVGRKIKSVCAPHEYLAHIMIKNIGGKPPKPIFMQAPIDYHAPQECMENQGKGGNGAPSKPVLEDAELAATRSDATTRSAGTNSIVLRPATIEDKRLVWEWRDHEDNRRTCFYQEPIEWAAHSSWYDEKMRDPNTLLYIIMNASTVHQCKRVGVARLDIANSEGIISVFIQWPDREKGYAKQAVNKIIRKGKEHGAKTFTANIIQTNSESIKLFTTLGFDNAGPIEINGIQGTRMTKEVKMVDLEKCALCGKVVKEESIKSDGAWTWGDNIAHRECCIKEAETVCDAGCEYFSVLDDEGQCERCGGNMIKLTEDYRRKLLNLTKRTKEEE